MGAWLGNVGWIGLGLLSALGAAGVAIFGKVGMTKLDTTVATTLRSIIMSLMLVAVTLGTGKLQVLWREQGHLDRRGLTFIVLAAFCGAASWMAYFAALQVGVAGKVAALDKLSVIFVLLLSVAFLGERHSWHGWLGLAMMVAGIYLVAGDSVAK